MRVETDSDNVLVAATAAALLGSFGKMLQRWSMLAALAAILFLGLKAREFYSVVTLSASFVAALLQAYLAARCAFDAAVFAALGGEASRYAGFDRLLQRWQLRAATGPDRCLEERAQGALRLLRRQAYSFLMQFVLLAIGLMCLAGEGT